MAAVVGVVCATMATGCGTTCDASAYADQLRVDLGAVQAAATGPLTVRTCIDADCSSVWLGASDDPTVVRIQTSPAFPGNDHTIRVTARTADLVEVFSGTALAVPLVVDYPPGERCSTPINVISVKAEGRSTLEVLAPQ
ncbi:hypothetical protein D1871_20055 [Nakamurella silvestris]|nr:hypothetical protein D1871_20055 [Nakamurella silvestris]